MKVVALLSRDEVDELPVAKINAKALVLVSRNDPRTIIVIKLSGSSVLMDLLLSEVL